MVTNNMRPIHPGEVLREEYLEPLGMSANALSIALHIPAPRINDVVRENAVLHPTQHCVCRAILVVMRNRG